VSDDADARTRPPQVAAARLDGQQRAAASAPAGPLLILAGAGSGKTRVLTERAAALAERVGPQAVLVITFTNRAGEELRERLAALLGEDAGGRVTSGTFHAVCHRMLRAHAGRVGRSPRFSIYDRQASRRLLATALGRAAPGTSCRPGWRPSRSGGPRPGCSARPATGSWPAAGAPTASPTPSPATSGRSPAPTRWTSTTCCCWRSSCSATASSPAATGAASGRC
jgi:UvrD/REP helicase N-terminal domain